MECDVCVIGGGAAGLMAGIFSAETGARTVIVESGTSAGRKLLRTGRGRCNLTHTGTIDDLVRAYGVYGRFLKHSLHEFSCDDLRGFFRQRGLESKVEGEGLVFPITDRAVDVRRVLVDTARRVSVRFAYGKSTESIEKVNGRFEVRCKGTEVQKVSEISIRCGCVIVATGGVSWPVTVRRVTVIGWRIVSVIR